jgi:thioredoxin reductase (NADPH)
MKTHDLVIIGAGPAGMNAALYAARGSMNVLIIEKGLYGGQMQNTDEIENLIGFGSITGPELSQKMKNQIDQYENIQYSFDTVNQIIKNSDGTFLVKLTKEDVSAKSIIIATGTSPRKLNVPGELEGAGKGVSYCAVCDGAFFKNREVAVVGGGDSALEEALYLAEICAKVTIIHRRDEFRATPIYHEQVLKHPKIELKLNATVDEIVLDPIVKKVIVNDVNTNQKSEIEVNGVFIYVGNNPQTAFLSDLNILDENGYVLTNSELQTTIEGVFAVGDVRADSFRQIVTAMGDGALAAQKAYHFVKYGNHVL